MVKKTNWTVIILVVLLISIFFFYNQDFIQNLFSSFQPDDENGDDDQQGLNCQHECLSDQNFDFVNGRGPFTTNQCIEDGTEIGLQFSTNEWCCCENRPPVVPTCTDTDGGQVFTIKGTTTDNTGSDTDICPLGDFTAPLTEIWCSELNIRMGASIDCAAEFAGLCYDGRCIPLNQDTDGDGFEDIHELEQGTDPNDPTDFPGSSICVFVTSGIWTGPMGGQLGTDQKCDVTAQFAGLPGPFVSIISTDIMPSNFKVLPGLQIKRCADGALVATGVDDLFDGILINPINLDEHGNVQNVNVWTGSDVHGFPQPETCHNWGWIDDIGRQGDSSKINSKWIDNNIAICDTGGHLYCIQAFPLQ